MDSLPMAVFEVIQHNNPLSLFYQSSYIDAADIAGSPYDKDNFRHLADLHD
jgi:hypothetical protein